MGFNSVAVVLNDALGYIKNDTNIGEKIVEAVQATSAGRTTTEATVWARDEIHGGSHGNAIQIISQAHADWPQVVVVYGNTGWNLDDKDAPHGAERAAADALQRRGWKVSPPKQAVAS